MLEPGTRVGNFEVEALLGQGGLARVYRARHSLLGSRHALKVLSIDSPSLQRRLLREGSIQAQLRHPNVVAVTDVVEVDGVVALVMEYVEGSSLEQYLDQQGRLTIPEALALFAQILAGIGVAHQAGVLHRDLKPANVLLTPMGKQGYLAKVTDFGLAKLRLEEFGKGETLAGVLMGTPGYLAPEQARDSAAVDARADIFSLGVILYELLTGRSAFLRTELEDTLAATLSGSYTPVRELRPEIAPEVAMVVERCLQVDPADRFPNVHELARVLYGEDSELGKVADGVEKALPLNLTMVQRNTPANSSTRGRQSSVTVLPSLVPTDSQVAQASPATLPPPTVAMGVGAAVGAGLAVGLIFLLILGAGLFYYWSRETVVSSEPGTEASSGAPAASPPSSSSPPPETPALLTPPGGTPPVAVPPAVPSSVPSAPSSPKSGSSGASETPNSGTSAPTNVPPANEPPPAPEAPSEPVAPPVSSMVVARPEAPDRPPVDALVQPAQENFPSILGTWEGNWAGRPVVLRVGRQKGGNLNATLEVQQGEAARTFKLGGTVAADGKLSLSENQEGGLWLNGEVAGESLSGMLAFPGQKKGTAFKVRRQ